VARVDMVQARMLRASWGGAGLDFSDVHPTAAHVLFALAMKGAPGRAIQEVAGHGELGETQGTCISVPQHSTRRFDCSIGRGNILATAANNTW